jgi:3-hydroxybutyryl-CoA dehydrogenase
MQPDVEVSMTDITRIAIIGAGVMGHGIGQEFARAGYQVTLHRQSEQGLRQSLAWVERNLDEFVEWGLLAAGDVPSILARIHTATSIAEAVAGADLVIEAVVENLELKRQIFAEMDRLAPPHTILASNTSSIMPSDLASATQRPDRVLVAHFSYPPHLIPLVEIVRGAATSDETVERVRTAVERAGKQPIVLQKEATGFIINRMQAALQREALRIVADGIATAQDVDTAVTASFGRRLGVVGPLEMVEVQDGWDITRQIHEYILPYLDASAEPSPLILERMERGEIGPKSGRGFYSWTPASVDAWNRQLNEALIRFLLPDA